MYIEKERGKGQLSQSASFLKASFQISLKWDMAGFSMFFDGSSEPDKIIEKFNKCH